MIKEIYGRLPEIIKTLLQKASEVSCNNEKIQNARNNLFRKLNIIMDEMNDLSNNEGDKLSEEYIKKILEMPRSLPDIMKWKFKS